MSYTLSFDLEVKHKHTPTQKVIMRRRDLALKEDSIHFSSVCRSFTAINLTSDEILYPTFSLLENVILEHWTAARRQ